MELAAVTALMGLVVGAGCIGFPLGLWLARKS
jgi:hypothetical protein